MVSFSRLFQRYYGRSLPFGNSSFELPNVGLLTIEQALADYAVMITELKKQLGAPDCPVIVFGGRSVVLQMHVLNETTVPLNLSLNQ